MGNAGWTYAFGWDLDMLKFAPKAHLTANTSYWGDKSTETVKAVPPPGSP